MIFFTHKYGRVEVDEGSSASAQTDKGVITPTISMVKRNKYDLHLLVLLCIYKFYKLYKQTCLPLSKIYSQPFLSLTNLPQSTSTTLFLNLGCFFLILPIFNRPLSISTFNLPLLLLLLYYFYTQEIKFIRGWKIYRKD